MPRKKRTKQAPKVAETPNLYLRSANVLYDLGEPARIAHFHPTSKGISLVRNLFAPVAGRTFLVVAPYGSGKSLAATYLLHLVENRRDSHSVLKTIQPRLRTVDPALSRQVQGRMRSKRHGLSVALHGHQEDLPKALHDALLQSMARLRLGRQARPIKDTPCDSMHAFLGVLDKVQASAPEWGIDRVTIVWDEFGRHLEQLVAEGETRQLGEVQLLAEYMARVEGQSWTLGLLLHQSLLQYAAHASETARKEWAKIEGRFSSIQFVDDSQELYELLAHVLNARRELEPARVKDAKRWAEQASKLGLFRNHAKGRLAELVRRAYPLEPATLYLLPRVAGRIAQHERTIFSFLAQVDLSEPVGPDALYDFFASTMREDASPGGSRRQWLETESALSKVAGDRWTEKALKTACLFGLGISGERTRTSKDLLQFAVAGFIDEAEAGRAIDNLIERNLLLYRRHNADVSVWHGTDLDIRSRIEEEKERHRGNFAVEEFINKEQPPPIWRPVEYNDDYAIRRYFDSVLMTIRSTDDAERLAQDVLAVGRQQDGKVIYLMPDGDKAARTAQQVAKLSKDHPRVFLAITGISAGLQEVALEVYSLLRLQHDPNLAEVDPLAGSEIAQLVDDARSHLDRLLERILYPGRGETSWYYLGRKKQIRTPNELRVFLSKVMREVYPKTPRINNELIVRRKPSQVVVNARKKLVLGILERHGMPALGLEGHTPDVSMFYTVLVRTGIYRIESNVERYASPEEMQDEGIREAWAAVRDFFAIPTEGPRSFAELFKRLDDPPLGVRRGLHPIFVAAGLKAFGHAISITKDGAYLEDILPSEIEEICREPDCHHVRVFSLGKSNREYLRKLIKLFGNKRTNTTTDNDLIRASYDVVVDWFNSLPPGVTATRQLSERASVVLRVIQTVQDPGALFFERLPQAVGECSGSTACVREIAQAKEELEGVVESYREAARWAIRDVIGARTQRVNGSLRELIQEWAELFPTAIAREMGDQSLQGLVSRSRIEYSSDEELLDSFAHLLVGRSIGRWDDSAARSFTQNLQQSVNRVEQRALEAARTTNLDNADRDQLATMLANHMAHLYVRLKELVGDTAARTYLEKDIVLDRSNGGADTSQSPANSKGRATLGN